LVAFAVLAAGWQVQLRSELWDILEILKLLNHSGLLDVNDFT
jgi:hypothetical protein